MPLPIRIVFTDLDGTLLDHATYAFEPARPALRALQERGIPLVCSTSKTFAETAEIQERLGVRGPLIVENGGALYFPTGWPRRSPTTGPRTWERLVLGVSRERLVSFLRSYRSRTGVALRGFSDMTVADLCEATGLAPGEAGRALRREFDEPFQLDRLEDLPRLAASARAEGLDLTTGGRFHHLSGGTDKGQAARILCDRLREAEGPFRSVGLGDSPNDLPLLAAVDLPVVVPHPGGTHDPELLARIPEALLAPEPGPAGWAAVVLVLLEASDAAR